MPKGESSFRTSSVILMPFCSFLTKPHSLISMQQNASTSESLPPHSAATELLTQLSGQQNRGTGQAPDPAQVAAFLQQQGAVPTGMNIAEPAAQAHLFHILSQMGPQGWGAANQASNSQTLESILATISRQPEIAASLPSFLSSLTGNIAGQQQQPQLKGDGSGTAQLDATGQGSYTAQLYGNAGTGMGQEAEGKDDGSGDMTGAAALEQDPALAKANSVKCAKEKNRQAQRRFRERQKGLIQALKERADSLQKQVEEQRHQIETLEKENKVLKVILQEKKP